MKNPYPTHKGFGFRVVNAKRSLEKYGRDCSYYPFTRGFDNCFEMFDRKAVVWALMREALNGNRTLEQGIKNMGAQCWEHWLKTYRDLEPEAQPDLFSQLGF